MKKWKLSTKTKQMLSIAFLVLSIAFFVLSFAFKSRLTDYASQLVRVQTDSGTQNIESIKVDSAFNYKKNGLPYEVTFLEFGATGCSACKRMEIVMSEIREKYSPKVNVVFLNVLLPQNQNMMKYFGIASIPTQVLLNKEGKSISGTMVIYPRWRYQRLFSKNKTLNFPGSYRLGENVTKLSHKNIVLFQNMSYVCDINTMLL